MNFTIITTSHGQKVQRLECASIRRFYRHVRTIKWQVGTSVYVRVSYGKYIDNFGKKITFYNDGIYTSKNDLFFALDAFTEL